MNEYRFLCESGGVIHQIGDSHPHRTISEEKCEALLKKVVAWHGKGTTLLVEVRDVTEWRPVETS